MSQPPEAAAHAARLPAVSVIMPVLNEEAHLREAVAGVLSQAYGGELELILAIGPSHDATAEIAAELSARDPQIVIVDNPSGRTPDALNAALRAARHDIIVRVDGHGVLSPGYIDLAVRLLEETGAANVGGLMAAEGTTDFEKAVALAMTSPLGVGSAKFHTGGTAGPAPTVYLGVFRREWLDAVGGYDPAYTRAQDWEMNHRLREAGGVIWFTPDLRVTYRPRGTLGRLARQYRDYGRWRRVVMDQHPQTVSLRYLAAPAATTACVAGAVVGLVWRPALAIPLGYATAVTAGGLAISRGERAGVRARMPLVLATMHHAWGWGFLTSRPRKLAQRRYSA